MTPEMIEAASAAYWNAIPCHVPWDQYDNEAGKKKTRECMAAALTVAMSMPRVSMDSPERALYDLIEKHGPKYSANEMIEEMMKVERLRERIAHIEADRDIMAGAVIEAKDRCRHLDHTATLAKERADRAELIIADIKRHVEGETSGIASRIAMLEVVGK